MRVVATIGLLMVVATGADAAAAETPRQVAHIPDSQCQSMASVDFSTIDDAPTQLVSASAVAEKGDVPAYCKLQGTISSTIGIELRLPLANWNGKFMEVGCGGWCGYMPAYQCDAPMQRGYACVASDSGHKGSAQDVSWAQGNLQAQIDFGYRAVHVAAVAGKVIAERFYTQAPSRAYFVSCSTGGYQGLVESQRFPWDFNGIVAGAPDIDQAGANLRALWALRAMIDESTGKPRLSADDVKLVHKAALARCDLDDGVRDGIIGNAPACDFNPATLTCKASQSSACLTPAQVDTVKKLYSGPTTSAGTQTAGGAFLPGSELQWSQFWPAAPLEQFFRAAIPGFSTGPQWKYTDLDFDRDYQRLGLAAHFENSNPDLRRFKQAGGKLIIYHGATDAIDPPKPVIDYYETVERTMGGRKATQDFFRLFVIPGMNHCAGGDGATVVDYLSYLEAWVEQGQAPDRLVSAHLKPGRPGNIGGQIQRSKAPLDPASIEFSRPVYPYPTTIRYRGHGDVNDAASFKPVRAK